MTQAERDRLVSLKKVKKGMITQAHSAEELGVSSRQVRRMLAAVEERGDEAVIHALSGRQSNRRIAEKSEQEALKTFAE